MVRFHLIGGAGQGVRLRLLAILMAFTILAVSGEHAQTQAPATKPACASGRALGSTSIVVESD